MSYGLGVDLGTTYTAAAVSDASSTRAVQLGRDVTVPSVAFVTEGGEVITGDAAESQAILFPQRVSRSHKRRLADPAPLSIGGRVWSPAALMAAQLRDVVALVTAMKGQAPGFVVLTCPAVWGPYRREHFAEVPRLAGLKNVRIITEPEAAAMHYSVERRLGDGETIGVYDLGGGTFDATVLRARPGGMQILGTPEGVERLGGIDFDDSLLAFLDSRLGGEITALDVRDRNQARMMHEARDACRQAKERLSAEVKVSLHLDLPCGRREMTVTRTEFYEVIGPQLALTTEALTRTIGSAGLRPEDLASVLLVGGSSQIPLVAQTVSAVYGKPMRVGLHPKLTVALGAAAIARAEAMRVRPVSPPLSAPPPRLQHTGLLANKNLKRKPLRRFGKRTLVAGAVAAAVVLAAGVLIATMPGGRPAQPGGMATAGKTTSGNTSAPDRPTSDGPAPTRTESDGPAPTRTESDRPAPTRTAPDFVRDGQDVDPFHSTIGSEANWSGTQIASDGSAAHPAITVRAADLNGKGDGRRVTWTGTAAAQFYLQNPAGRLDARPFLGSGTLAFAVVVARPPTAQVSLATHCHYPCQAPLNATELFKNLPVGEQRTVRIPLSCFAAKGLDPSNVDVPFLVHTTGAFQATFGQIRWEADGTAKGVPVTACTSLS
ncbi:Hsp70 protein [Lentzea waywayandensis]|uniref:Hsp70 protein n=2 Tax=Lentzea waywayandensis TaxID=84724 RepID=A0A1I6FJR4_9PSEU|nr:Hsp70 protein [Lentzea waywayandensis]